MDVLKALVAVRDIALLLERQFGTDWFKVLMKGLDAVKAIQLAETTEKKDEAIKAITDAFNAPI